MLMHGLKKLGYFGEGDFQSSVNGLNEHFNIPVFIAYLVILAETLGASALILGFMTRVMAGCITVVLIGAAFMNQDYFFMNWSGNQTGEGYEFHLLAIAIGVALMIKGAGALSLDSDVFQKRRKRFGSGLYQ